MFKWRKQFGIDDRSRNRSRRFNKRQRCLLEKLEKRYYKYFQYEVIEEIRITGMEVDLLAKNKETNEEILVECKAHSSNLSADVITKLVGKCLYSRCFCRMVNDYRTTR